MIPSEAHILEMIQRQVLSDQNLSLLFQDDCGRIMSGANETLLSTDMLMEDVHFRRALTSARDLGWKALAVNLSDLAAKGAEPLGFLMSWSLPQNLQKTWISDFLSGLDDCARQFHCPLIGGDTTASKGPIAISITVVGKGGDTPYRTRAQGGDIVAVTGALGKSALGLSIQENEWLPEVLSAQIKHEALRYHHRPWPRIQEGQWLKEHGARAMMDLSDGVFADLPKLAAASGLGYDIDIGKLPISSEILFLQNQGHLTKDQARNFSWLGGEDFELLVTLPAQSAVQICEQFVEAFDRTLTPIGHLFMPESSSQVSTWKNPPKESTGFPTLRFAHFGEEK